MNRLATRIGGIACLLAAGAMGCSSSTTAGGGGGSGGGGAEEDASGGSDSASPEGDSGMLHDGGTNVDASGNGSGDGGALLGATCTQNSDCASNMCVGFRMQTVLLCTQPCTAASDCPMPPTAGACTPKGYCKFN